MRLRIRHRWEFATLMGLFAGALYSVADWAGYDKLNPAGRTPVPFTEALSRFPAYVLFMFVVITFWPWHELLGSHRVRGGMSASQIDPERLPGHRIRAECPCCFEGLRFNEIHWTRPFCCPHCDGMLTLSPTLRKMPLLSMVVTTVAAYFMGLSGVALLFVGLVGGAYFTRSLLIVVIYLSGVTIELERHQPDDIIHLRTPEPPNRLHLS